MSTRQIGEILAENLSLALAKTKLTRTEVADKAGISRARLSSLENHNTPIRATELWDIAAILGVEPAWFYSEHLSELAVN
jgi:transcriptional regulator with XRE-family HTH domain